MTKSLVLVVVLITLFATGNAWWCYGHMLVANIAKLSLCPGTAVLLETLLQPEAKYSPKAPDFIQAACWADDEKPTNPLFNTWHYINQPLVIDRPPMNIHLPYTETTNSVVWAIDTLKTTLQQRAKASPMDVARALYLLIHFVGDLHQPLHAATLFSDKFPTGDVGGNNYKISYDKFTNLHAFWDSGASLWPDDPPRPLAQPDASALNKTAAMLVKDFPMNKFETQLKDYRVQNWAYESFNLARTSAYTAPEAPTKLSDGYVKSAQNVCRSQVALGGYRLAQILHNIFGCL